MSSDDLDLIDRLRGLLASIAAADTTLPAEPALAASLGASRPALREALMRLEAEGLLSRRRGAGTTINRLGHSIPARFDQQVEFIDVIAATGRVPGIEVLEAGDVALSAESAARLGRAEGQLGFRTVKRWTADGEPVMVAVDEIPVEGPGHGADPADSLFTNAAALTGFPVEWEIARPGATVSAGAVARWLGAKNRPLLTLDLLGVSRTGEPLYRAVEYHVPGAVGFGFVRTVGGS